MRNLILIFLLQFPLLLAAQEWYQPQLSGGGYWPLRVPVRMENKTDREISPRSVPFELSINPDDSTGALIGTPVKALRVMDANGSEYCFDLLDSSGNLKHTGEISRGDAVRLPPEVAPHEMKTYYLYGANPTAMPVAYWLELPFRPLFRTETTQGPVGWNSKRVPGYLLTVDEYGGRNGKPCGSVKVKPGNTPAYCGYSQDSIPLEPGVEYQFSAWCKRDEVEGVAGWALHILADGKRVSAPAITKSGSADWEKIVIPFTAPTEKPAFRPMTVLYSSGGTAKFDEALLRRRGSRQPVVLTPEPAETKELKRIGTSNPWPENKHLQWRAELKIRNFSADAQKKTAEFDLRSLQNQARKLLGFNQHFRWYLADSDNPNSLVEIPDAHEMQYTASVPASSEKILYLYLDNRPLSPGEIVPLAAVKKTNLLKNGSAEQGTDTTIPGWTASVEKTTGESRFLCRRTQGGINGQWCFSTTIPDDEKRPQWSGWRQKIPVSPRKRYTVSAFIESSVQNHMYGHFLDADGKLLSTFLTYPSGNLDEVWQRHFATVMAPADARFLEIHLTTDCRGTIRHDAVSVVEGGEHGVVGALTPRTEARPETLSVWTQPMTVKPFHHDLPAEKQGMPIRVYAPRNSFEPIQVLLRHPAGGTVCWDQVLLRNSNGATLPVPHPYMVGYVFVDQPVGTGRLELNDSNLRPDYSNIARGTDGWSGLWPDPLIPVRQNSVWLNPDSTVALVLDFKIPKDTPPGIYRGNLTLSMTGEPAVVCPIELTVWRFQLPEKNPMLAMYEVRGGGAMAFDEDGHARKLRIARWLKPYGISPVTVPSAPVFQWKDGKFTADFSDFDRDVEFLFNECDVNKLFVPKCFELGGWSKPIRPFLSVPFGIDGYDRVFSIAYREMAEHLRQKGWIDRFIYFIADEPHESATDTISGIAHVARMARRIAPEIPIYCSTWYWMPELEDALSMWGLGSVGRVVTGEQLAKINAAGVKWMFTVDGQINIDTPMNGYERILGWLSYKYGAAGYEFWGADWYTFDPWEFGFHRTVEIQMDAKHHSRARFPNGDGYVIYPGRSAGEEPLPSLRLLAARAGIGDYALFQALKQTAKPGDADAAKALKAVCDTVKLPHPMRQSSVFLPDPERMERCRENAGCTLDKLLRQRDLSQP